MPSYTPPPWSLRPESSPRGQRYVIRTRTREVAADIANLADARIIQAAPHLFEFARALCVAVLPQAWHLRDSDDPREIVALCAAMMPTIHRAGQKPN